ncbi:TRAP transporter substrate-binding protein [Jiella sp. MQZ9-1]|uniref:TRAP transporter substrate-binding protein n=1 Tax=Jiella flava TaxID=2816857 RepID=A0A939JVL2_9HYPH|nr:TRAP transporter substrate-binding protein [Jiella flava]MBO0662584.1 TRAP transporter substrate-binding protein [Jiella flava]MCD2472955.1 TRAP transporter substrate-binding protein [Jiella flava]
MKTLLTCLTLSACLTAATLPANAQNLDDTSLSVVGSWSSLPLDKDFERPFWTKTLPADSQGKVSVQMTTFDQMGVKGGDVFRMLSDGVFDVGMTVGDYVVGDAPELEGLDVPLVASDADTEHKVIDAARPMVADIMKKRFGAKLLAIVPYPPQVVFCNADVKSLRDLKGKKVRASGRMAAILLEKLGAEGITMSFSEVPGALERGVIDCAVTGAGSGYSAGWWESSTHLLTLPLGGWDPVITAMNQDKWNGLSPAMQSFLETEIKTKFEDKVWAAAGDALSGDVACLTGRGECKAGKPASMTLVEPTKQDEALAKKVLTEDVLPDWAKRAGGDWAKRWNDSVGKVVGVSVAAP